MKKSTISLLLGAMLAVTATAETLTPTEALLRAQSSIPQSLKAKMPALRSAKSAELVYTVADSLTAEPAVYAFNQGGLDDGFVIVCRPMTAPCPCWAAAKRAASTPTTCPRPSNTGCGVTSNR